MKGYPNVHSEELTLANCQTRSIARFGDGEWRCAVGGGCTSQRADPRLAAELKVILRAGNPRCMVAIPNPFHPDAPRRESWIRYTEPKFASLLSAGQPYWSSFITRPDNAPWIDTPAYWDGVRALWRGKDVVLVTGDKKSITTEMIGDEAKSVVEVIGPRQHAYADADRLMREIHLACGEQTDCTILLCLGTTATVLAWRLSLEGYHALDLGHIGMFMRHAGAYRYNQDDLTSAAYRHQITTLHRTTRWGVDGVTHADAIDAFAGEVDAKTILDYGCGQNTLSDAMARRPSARRVSGYDPGIPDRVKMPKPCDLVVCTDVLEHVEEEKLDAVLDHIYRLSGKATYFSISVRPARAVLPDGRNAHICLHEPEWWLDRLRQVGWNVDRVVVKKNVNVWALKP